MCTLDVVQANFPRRVCVSAAPGAMHLHCCPHVGATHLAVPAWLILASYSHSYSYSYSSSTFLPCVASHHVTLACCCTHCRGIPTQESFSLRMDALPAGLLPYLAFLGARPTSAAEVEDLAGWLFDQGELPLLDGISTEALAWQELAGRCRQLLKGEGGELACPHQCHSQLLPLQTPLPACCLSTEGPAHILCHRQHQAGVLGGWH
jgi:hypothetical protein